MARVFIDGVLQTTPYRYTFTESANSVNLTLPSYTKVVTDIRDFGFSTGSVSHSNQSLNSVVINNKLYVSSYGNISLYKYSPATNTWMGSPEDVGQNNSPIVRSTTDMGVYNGELYLMRAASAGNFSLYKCNLDTLTTESICYKLSTGLTGSYDTSMKYFKTIINTDGKLHWFFNYGSSTKYHFIMDLNAETIDWDKENNSIKNYSAIDFIYAHFVVYNNKIRAVFRDKYLDYDDINDTWIESTRTPVATGTDTDFRKQIILYDSQGREHQIGTFAEANNHVSYDYIYNPSTGVSSELFAQLPDNNNYAGAAIVDGYLYLIGSGLTYNSTDSTNKFCRVSATSKGGNSWYQPNEFESTQKLYTITKESIS